MRLYMGVCVFVCGGWKYGLKSKPKAIFKAALITVSFVGLLLKH